MYRKHTVRSLADICDAGNVDVICLCDLHNDWYDLGGDGVDNYLEEVRGQRSINDAATNPSWHERWELH